MAELGMSLKSSLELTRHIMTLYKLLCTTGLEVVWWQNVDPVGGIVGGYLDL